MLDGFHEPENRAIQEENQPDGPCPRFGRDAANGVPYNERKAESGNQEDGHI